MPAAVVAAAVVRLAWPEHGSIAARDWLSTALLVALLAATALLAAPAIRPTRTALAAAGALTALAVWDAASAAWSPVPSLARDEALLVVLYVLCFLLPAVTVRPARDGPLVVALVVAALGGTAFVAAAHVALSGSAGDLHGGRLNFPVGYENADAALFAVAFWPAVAFAAGRTRTVVARATAFGAAALVLATVAATQSKGATLGLVVSAIVIFSASRARLRFLVPVALALVLVAFEFSALTRPYREAGTDAIRGMGRALVLVAFAGVVVGALYALADRRVSLSQRTRALVSRVALVATVVAVLAALSGFLFAHPHTGRYLSQKWSTFKAGYTQTDTASTHFASLGSNRYDFWRVALKEFDRHPLAGVGARGFQDAYLQLRKSPETPARTHSVELDALSETGIVGFLLLAVGLGLALATVAPRARDRLLAGGVLGAAVGWLTHASVDWVWTFPAVSIPVFLLLGAAAGDDVRRRLSSRASLVSAIAAVLVAVVLFAPPWLAARLVDRGTLDSARWAKRLDPLSVDPYLVESALATTPSDRVVALQEAVRKQPRDPALHYVLGLAWEQSGFTDNAHREYLAAQRLDPHDPLIERALRRTSRQA